MEKKITKREVYGMLLEVEGVKGNSMFEEFIAHEIELLEKKSAKSGTSKVQKENVEIKAKLLSELALVGEPVTVSDFQKKSAYAGQFSNQKVSALLKQMVADFTVVKAIEKGKSYFSVAIDEVEVEEVEE